MRYFVVLHLLVASMCFAGHPAEDPNVSGLREAFSVAHIPTVGEFQHQSVYDCTESSAVRGNFAVLSRPAFIKVYDGGLVGYFSNIGSAKPSLFSYVPEGATGAFEDYVNGIYRTYRLVLRGDAQAGEIFGEWSVMPVDGDPAGAPDAMAPSLAISGYEAVSYFRCQKLDF